MLPVKVTKCVCVSVNMKNERSDVPGVWPGEGKAGIHLLAVKGSLLTQQKSNKRSVSLILQLTHSIKLFSILSLILFVQFEPETILVINYSSGRIFVCIW